MTLSIMTLRITLTVIGKPRDNFFTIMLSTIKLNVIIMKIVAPVEVVTNITKIGFKMLKKEKKILFTFNLHQVSMLQNVFFSVTD